MSSTKISAMVLCSVLLGGGPAAYLLASGRSQEKKDPHPIKEGDKELLHKKEVLENAKKVFELTLNWHDEGGPISFEDLYTWSVRWLESELDLSREADARTTALKSHLERMKSVETQASEQRRMGGGRVSDLNSCRYYRAQAEMWLERGEMKR
jgi:hypothetical protein